MMLKTTKYLYAIRKCFSGEFMIPWILLLAILIVSLIIAIKAADIFVDNLVDIGQSLGISEIILGVTASAIGTSLLEFGSAMTAVLTGSPDVGVGCVVGSNIWNIAGILGISAAFAGIIRTNPEEIKRDGMMTLLVALALMFFIFFVGKITRIVAFILIVLYAGYLWQLVKAQKRNSALDANKGESKSFNYKTLLWTILGLIGLIIGCRMLVYSSVELARLANISEMLIGLTILAIGTSVPEFVVTLTSAMKGLHSLSLGNILGSNIFNILIGIGFPALFMNIPVEKVAISFDTPAMIFFTLLLLLLMGRGMKLTRLDGLILLAFYITYIGTRIYISV